ncbi:MAG: thioredoxin [Leptolyngbyaceae cyanobacterium]
MRPHVWWEAALYRQILIQTSSLGNAIMSTATFIENETTFDSLLENEPLLVVDCTATWCGPCKLVAPLMDQLADEYSDRVKVFKLDLDANKPVAKRFGIRSIPAVMFFKQGELVETLVGVKPYETFTETLEKLL